MALPLQGENDKQDILKKYPVCPKCKKRMEDRVPRGSIVKTFLFWLPLKRYRCYNCGRKNYIFTK